MLLPAFGFSPATSLVWHCGFNTLCFLWKMAFFQDFLEITLWKRSEMINSLYLLLEGCNGGCSSHQAVLKHFMGHIFYILFCSYFNSLELGEAWTKRTNSQLWSGSCWFHLFKVTFCLGFFWFFSLVDGKWAQKSQALLLNALKGWGWPCSVFVWCSICWF